MGSPRNNRNGLYFRCREDVNLPTANRARTAFIPIELYYKDRPVTAEELRHSCVEGCKIISLYWNFSFETKHKAKGVTQWFKHDRRSDRGFPFPPGPAARLHIPKNINVQVNAGCRLGAVVDAGLDRLPEEVAARFPAHSPMPSLPPLFYMLFLSLFSVLLPLEGAVLGLSTAIHPVAAAQHYQPAQAVPPAIEAFDCFHPTDVKTYNISQHCPSLEPTRTDPHRAEVYILQQDFTHRMLGFRCSMTRGTRRFVCGTFSYEKALRGPVANCPSASAGPNATSSSPPGSTPTRKRKPTPSKYQA